MRAYVKATLLSVIVLTALSAAIAGSAASRAWSPASGRSAATVSPPGLYVFDARKRSLKRLVQGAAEREDLSWAPDGQWIASTDTSDFLVDVIRPDGGALRDVVSVLWSPGGERAAYATDAGLFIGSSVNGDSTRVSDDGDPIDWTAAGGELLFGIDRPSSCCWPSLGVARGDGTNAQTLWTAPATGGHDSWIDDAAFSPDGREIAIGATINNGVESDNGGEFVYLATPDKAGATKISYEPSGMSLSGWSADGNWLILESDSSLFRVRPSGGDAEPLCVQSCRDAALSPDHREVAYLTTSSRSSVALWVANTDGSGVERLATLPTSSSFTWSSDSQTIGLSLPKDRRHSRVAVLNVATRKVQRLTKGSQADYIADVSSGGRFIAFFRLKLKATHDGLALRSAALWVVSANGGPARKVMTLASGPLGPCPLVAWSPTAPQLAVANEACAPS